MASSNEQQPLREAVASILGMLKKWIDEPDFSENPEISALKAAHEAPNAYGDRDVAALISDAQAWLGDGPAPPARKILEALAALPAAPAPTCAQHEADIESWKASVENGEYQTDEAMIQCDCTDYCKTSDAVPPTDAERVTKGLERDRDDARQQLGDVRIALEDAGYERKTLAAAVKALDEDRTDACQKRDALRKQLDEAKAEVDRLASELDPPVCRLQLPDGSVPGNAREAAEMWHAACQEMWKQRDEARRERDERAEQVDIQQQDIDNIIVACGSLGLQVGDVPGHVRGLRVAANARAVEELSRLMRWVSDHRESWLQKDGDSYLSQHIADRIATLKAEPQPSTTVLTPEDMGADPQRELPQPSTEPEQPGPEAPRGAHPGCPHQCDCTDYCKTSDAASPAEAEPSMVQCNYDDPDIVPKLVEALDGLDSRVRKLEGRR